MSRALHLLLFVATILSGAGTAWAKPFYMVMEQDRTGAATHTVLNVTTIGDGIDPKQTHTALNRPTDPETSQVLWEVSDTPIEWVHSNDNNRFMFIEAAILPEGSRIDYSVFVHGFDVELINLRHSRSNAIRGWGLNQATFSLLPQYAYVVKADIVIPGRETQTLTQRVDVIGDPIMDEPNPVDEPDPVDNPNTNPDPVIPTIPVAAAGFTPLVKDKDTQVIFVSDSMGNDANNGLSPQTPVKTLKRGVDLLRDGRPDWLLLKCGDAWDGQSFDGVHLGGAAADKPMVISTYGEGHRPVIIPPHGENGFKSVKHKLDGLLIQGLHFYAATRDPGSKRYVARPGDVDGINIRIPSGEGRYVKGLIIEDCLVTHFDSNIKIVDDWSRFQGEGVPGRIEANVRRNIIRFSSSKDSHSIGIYLEGTRDTIIEQNLIDHNGWTQADSVAQRNKASHNIYAQWANGPITVRHNIISRGAAHGMQLRAGGNIDHNLFVRNAMAFFTSLNNSRASYNVILESEDMNTDVPEDRRGYGINGWDMDRYEVIGNIVARRAGSLQKAGIDVSASHLVVKNNIVYDWIDNRIDSSIIYHSGNATASGNLAKEYFNGKEPNYADPSRGLDTYAGEIGLNPTTEAFLNYASTRPRGIWVHKVAPDVVAQYIRDGFEIVK